MPAGQFVHEAAFKVSLKVPGRHAGHSVSTVALHCTATYWPSWHEEQWLHCVLPAMLANFPV